MNKKPIKCIICGKFIAYKDIYNAKVKVNSIPDTEYTIESFDFTHLKCIK